MKNLILFASRHPWPVLLLAFLVTLLSASQLPKLTFNISAQSMMIEKGEEAEFYRNTLQTFGSEDIAILFLSDPQLFHVDKLQQLKRTIAQIEQLPFVKKTDSLFSVKHIQTIDDTIQLNPYLDNLPKTPQAVTQLQQIALANPFIANTLLSSSGHAMAINIYLDNKKAEADFDQTTKRALNQIIEPLNNTFEQAFHIGSSSIRAAISEKILADQKTVLPVALLVLLLTLGLTLKRLSGMAIPFITAGLSIIWTLGLMATLDIPVNVMTAIVPALLLIIGSTEDIHLLSEYLTGISLGLKRRPAIERMANKMALAVSLTFITTYLGFLSIASNSLQLLREFGLMASTGLLLNFIITLFLVPVMLRLFGSQRKSRKSANQATLMQKSAIKLFHWVQQHRLPTLIVAIMILVASSWGASLLRVNNNSLDYFDAQSPLIQDIHALQSELAGIQTFSVVLSSGIEGTFLKTRYLEEVVKLQHFLEEEKIADKSLSFADYLAMIDRAMMGEEQDQLQLPENDAEIQEYMLFIDHPKVRGFISQDYSEVRILVRHAITSSFVLGKAVDKIQQYASLQLDPGLTLHTTGQSILTAKAADYLASAQAKSLLLMILVIMVIVSLLFMNFKAGIFAVIPNLFPIIVLFGIMGFTGIPLDTGTAMTAAIAIGICVDDTMHFMVRYHQISQTEKQEHKVLEITVREEAIPIMSTTLALAMGFATLGLSSFPPIAYFGLLSALVMVLALVATFVITPTLLSYTRLITVWDLISVQLKSEVLSHCKLFADMNPWQIKKTILLGNIQTYQKGQKIIRQGDVSRDFFVILEGNADASILLENRQPQILQNMRAGEVFGEIALLSQQPRTADVVAMQDMKVLVMDWDSISRITRIYPRIAAKLFRNLSAILGNRLLTGKHVIGDE